MRVLEEDVCFNAGRGSVLTAEGCIELDAAIMDGRSRAAGAVAGLRSTRAPINSPASKASNKSATAGSKCRNGAANCKSCWRKVGSTTK